jgi:2-oxoglutarate dehydrogenase E2 component (dihydrolipoamide succinyltransferase)
VTIDIQSPLSGKVLQLHVAQGSEVQVDQPFLAIEEGAPTPQKASVAAPTPVASKPSAAPSTPAAAPAPPAPAKKAPEAPAAAPVKLGDRSENRVKMTRMRQKIAERLQTFFTSCTLTFHCRLKSAQNVAAMLTTFQEVDMGPLMDMRNKHKEEFEKKHGVKLGFMSAFVKVSSPFPHSFSTFFIGFLCCSH